MVHELKTNADGSVYEPNHPAKPGDTIILPEKFTGIYIPNLKGTPDNPIRITNKGLSVGSNGIDLNGCQYVEVLGTGDSTIKEGIVIDHANNPVENDAFAIHGYAKNIRISNVRAINNHYGARIKNEASCDLELNKHTITDITVENSTFLNSKFQHLYIGSTNINGKAPDRQPICNGQKLFIPPPQTGNITVCNSNFDGSGRAAVQVSQAMLGFGTKVYGNKVRNAGKETEGQGNGMNFGVSKINVHDNDISDTFVCGIAAYACPDISIVNNKIDRSGYRNGVYSTAWAWGIWIDDDDLDVPMPIHFVITGNQIGARGFGGLNDGGWNDVWIGKRFGINHPELATYAKKNILSDNISTLTNGPAKIHVEAGIDWSEGETPSPIPPPIKKTILFTRTVTLNKVTKKYIIYTDNSWSAQ